MKKTQDWSNKTVNFATGCENDCKYCYAKGMAIRFRQVEQGVFKAGLQCAQDGAIGFIGVCGEGFDLVGTLGHGERIAQLFDLFEVEVGSLPACQ